MDQVRQPMHGLSGTDRMKKRSNCTGLSLATKRALRSNQFEFAVRPHLTELSAEFWPLPSCANGLAVRRKPYCVSVLKI